MDISFISRHMAHNTARIKALVEGVSSEDARWKPNNDEWSILEVVNHLYDEEREDFRVRLDIILHKPDQEWPPIDPVGWVLERGYNQRDLVESLADFLRERKASLDWLSGLGSPDWDAVYSSPFGSMRAGDIFTSWVTHDHLHMRQLIELHQALTQVKAKSYSFEYAGDW